MFHRSCRTSASPLGLACSSGPDSSDVDGKNVTVLVSGVHSGTVKRAAWLNTAPTLNPWHVLMRTRAFSQPNLPAVVGSGFGSWVVMVLVVVFVSSAVEYVQVLGSGVFVGTAKHSLVLVFMSWRAGTHLFIHNCGCFESSPGVQSSNTKFLASSSNHKAKTSLWRDVWNHYSTYARHSLWWAPTGGSRSTRGAAAGSAEPPPWRHLQATSIHGYSCSRTSFHARVNVDLWSLIPWFYFVLICYIIRVGSTACYSCLPFTNVRGKSHWKSSRWFLPFSVFYRSIAVGCELSLNLKMRTYKDEVHHKCIGTSTLAEAETLLGPRTEGFSGPPCP